MKIQSLSWNKTFAGNPIHSRQASPPQTTPTDGSGGSASEIVEVAYGIYQGISVGASPGIVGVFATAATQLAQASGGPLAGMVVGGVTGAMWGVTLGKVLCVASNRPVNPTVERVLMVTLGLANGLAGAGGASSPLRLGPVPGLITLAAGGGLIGGFIGGFSAAAKQHHGNPDSSAKGP